MAKKLWYSSSCIFLLYLFIANAVIAQVKPVQFGYLQRLEGVWVMQTKRSQIVEQWQRANDSTWQGQSFRIVGTDTTLLESMQMVRRHDGIFYVPTVVGQNDNQPVRFKVKVLKAEGFVAENPEHDFPQKILYRWKDETHLDARISGKSEGTSREIIFQYVKQ